LFPLPHPPSVFLASVNIRHGKKWQIGIRRIIVFFKLHCVVVKPQKGEKPGPLRTETEKREKGGYEATLGGGVSHFLFLAADTKQKLKRGWKEIPKILSLPLVRVLNYLGGRI